MSPTLDAWEEYVTAISDGLALAVDHELALTPDDSHGVAAERFAAEQRESLRQSDELSGDEAEGARWVAGYLVFRVVPSHVLLCFKALHMNMRYEGRILLRSLIEALDLMEYLMSDQCESASLLRWLKGEIIPNRLTRGAHEQSAYGAVNTLRGRIEG